MRALGNCVGAVLIIGASAGFFGAGSSTPELALKDSYAYCIVGAGPGGLQLGHYFHKKSRDYIIFERQAIPSSFFARFPVHRQLISLNKRFTGRDNPEFNMRHDWNSLLDTDAIPVTDRATARFPSADVLVEYMADFAQPQEQDGHISYNTDVKTIDREDHGEAFSVQVQRSAYVDGETWYYDAGAVGTDPGPVVDVACRVVIMANGLWVPNKVPLEGIELATGYEELPSTGESFENQAVTVLGMGNAALETANAMADYAQYVHIWPTRDGGPQWPHTSWESRYVGSARAIRMGPVDGYLLKSLDGLPLGDVVVASPNRMVIRSCMAGKKCLLHKSDRRKTPDGEPMIDLCGGACPAETVQEFDRDPVSKGLYIEKQPGESFGMTMLTRMDGSSMDDYRLGNVGHSVFIALSNITDSNIDRLFELKLKQAGTLSRPYDTVVRAMGWKHNVSVYGDGARPLLQSQKKYARMTIFAARYHTAKTLSGLPVALSTDSGKSLHCSSGKTRSNLLSAHRYTARALHHILEEKYEGEQWPSKHFAVPLQTVELAQHIVARQNSASAPYQMFYTLGDAMIFREGANDEWTVDFMQDVPVDYLNVKYKDSHRMWWTFGFNGQRRTLEESIKDGTGFEPWIWYWKPGKTKNGGRYREVFRAVENLHTDWSHKFIQDNVLRWIGERVKQLQSSKKRESAVAWRDDMATNITALADFHVVDIDMVIANHLDVPVTLLRGDEILKTLLPDTVLPKLTSFDGEMWTVHYKLPGGENVIRSWELKFERGIYQEIHISAEQYPWDSEIFNEDISSAGSSKRGNGGKAATPPYSHATFLATHTEPFCELIGPSIMDAIAARGLGDKFTNFESVKERMPNNAAWANLFEQVIGSIAAYAGMDGKDWEKAHMADAVTVLQTHHMDAVSAAAGAATEALLPILINSEGAQGRQLGRDHGRSRPKHTTTKPKSSTEIKDGSGSSAAPKRRKKRGTGP